MRWLNRCTLRKTYQPLDNALVEQFSLAYTWGNSPTLREPIATTPPNVHAVNRTLYHKVRRVMRKVSTTWHRDVSLIVQSLVIPLTVSYSVYEKD
jgi:hypothetical protein